MKTDERKDAAEPDTRYKANACTGLSQAYSIIIIVVIEASPGYDSLRPATPDLRPLQMYRKRSMEYIGSPKR